MRRALVIDDSRAVRKILRQTLSAMAFEVVEAEDGRDGVEKVAHNDLDLILVDWNMPVMDGLQFVEEVRGDPQYARVPILMVTTETGLDRVGAALNAGADDYLMKPFTDQALKEKLELIGIESAP